MSGILNKLKGGLSKTRSNLVDGISRAMTGKVRMDEGIYDAIEEKLIESDIGVDSTFEIIEALRQRLTKSESQNLEMVLNILKDDLIDRLNRNIPQTTENGTASTVPWVILVTGVNGVGKTTSIGKIANLYSQSGKKVIIGAADTFRAAASEQLEIWAERAGADLVRDQHGADAAAIAFNTVAAAKSRNADVAIIDTAGRLHNRSNLMEELRKIHRVIGKQIAGAPHESLLVLDATTGQNGLKQAEQFHQSIGLTGIILTKLDGTAKGGIVLSIQEKLQVPVKYVGVGEQLNDLQPFDATTYIEALLS